MEPLGAASHNSGFAPKSAIRKLGSRARRVQPDKDQVSQRIMDRVGNHPAFLRSRTVLWYVDIRDEVRTRAALARELLHLSPRPSAVDAPKLPDACRTGESPPQRAAVVPYCHQEDLRLAKIESMAELEANAYGILEPRQHVRDSPDRAVSISEVDLVLVPGVAFSLGGGRVGHGMGFYDRCLKNARRETVLMGIAFDCQVFQTVPTLPHDVTMDFVVTERTVYRAKKQAGQMP